MKTILTFLLLLYGITTYAQQLNTGLPAENAIAAGNGPQSLVDNTGFSPLSVQVLFGSQGIGADLKYGYSARLAFRAGFGVIPVSVNDAFSFNAFSTQDQLSAKFTNAHLLADYSPFRSSHFRIVGGAGYIIKGTATAIISPTSGYSLGSTTVTKDQIGVLNAEVSWKGFAPYLGVGLFNSFPERLFNMNLDLGTYYMGSPGTTLTGTKLLVENGTQQPQFNKNMQGYHWLPVIQLNFNFRLK